MGHKVFIPLTDELIFDRPELISAPLRPYDESLACYHWLDVRIETVEENESMGTLKALSSEDQDLSSMYSQGIAA